MKTNWISCVLLLSASALNGAETAPANYCDIASPGAGELQVRPAAGDPPITDINWFARPVPNPANDWIVAYAMHNENYLYNLSNGQRIRIPDKSDAVATPDGRYMSVPSYYTPDGYVRFYDNEVLLDRLSRGEDTDDLEPVFVHEHDGLKQVFYQSIGHVRDPGQPSNSNVYRMMFSGTLNESGFRMVDYTFTESDEGLSVEPSAPIRLCPEIENDLMTPFISKDGQYVASYTSPISESRYTAGASLKIYHIANVDYDAGAARCEEVVDFGFAAGKADFSFDGNSLTFHISNVNYLTVFIDGGVPAQSDPGPLSTDVVVAQLTRDDAGKIAGFGGLRRVTTSESIGTGRYFPAYFPDGKLFYISHSQVADPVDRRFELHVVDADRDRLSKNLFADAQQTESATAIGKLWSDTCAAGDEYQYQDHELPWLMFSLSENQCTNLVENEAPAGRRNELLQACQGMTLD